MYTCGDYGGFACLDPSAPCVDDDDVTLLPGYDDESLDPNASTASSCYRDWFSDGDCDLRNNNKDCGESIFVWRFGYIPTTVIRINFISCCFNFLDRAWRIHRAIFGDSHIFASLVSLRSTTPSLDLRIAKHVLHAYACS